MLRTLLIALILVIPALADMTIRYTMDLKPSPYMPPQAIESTKAALGDMFDKGMVYTVKENGASYMKFGPTVTIFDPNTRMNTTLLIDKKIYAVTPPDSANLLAGDSMEQLKKMTDSGFKVSSDKTGNTRKFGDYLAEETQVKMEISMKAALAAQGQPPQPGMPESLKLVMSMWFPTATESETKPLLRKYKELVQLGMLMNDPMQQMGKLFGDNPQVAAQMQTLVQDSAKGGLMLSMEQATIMPGLARTMGKMQGKNPDDIGEDEPLLTLVMSLKEFSEGEAPDSLFQIPEGFKQVKPEEYSKIYQESMKERSQPKKPGEKKEEEKKEDKQ